MEIGDFIKYLEDVKRYSPNTLLAYKKDLLQFVEFCNRVELIDDWKLVTPKMVRRWEVLLMTGGNGCKGVSPKSVRRKLSALSTLFLYMMRNRLVDDNPVKTVVQPRIPKRLPVFVDSDSMDQLLDDVLVVEDDEFSLLRDRLVILTAYTTGMRRAELVSLKCEDVDNASSTIKVNGKGGRQRIVPMTQELAFLMNRYLAKRSEVVVGRHDTLFVTDKGSPVYDKFIYRLVVRYLGEVTTAAKRGPHVLRHSFATSLLNNGACIEAIRQLLGHSDLAATQVYTHTSMEGLKRIYNQAHPRSAGVGDES